MKVREIVANCEYEIQTVRARYTMRETRKGELIVEGQDWTVNCDERGPRMLILDQERK